MYTKEQLLNVFSLPLPGEEAQWRLAPAGRRIRMEALTDYRDAAVLVPLINNGSKTEILLTLRASYDGIHSAQVSFPGGKFEPHEQNAIAVALREAEEETGIPGNVVQVVGRLTPLHIPVSSMRVYPVVGFIEESFELKPDFREVQRIIQVPLNEIEREPKLTKEIKQLEGLEVPYFSIDGEIVWGATAMILAELFEVFRQTT